MHYTFVEIGTSDFETLIQSCSDSDIGLSIDPLKIYLDKLPNKQNVQKINAAISNSDGTISCYYVPDDEIEKYGLPHWVRGCNSIGQYHKTVYELLVKFGIPTSIIKSIEIPKLSMISLHLLTFKTPI